MDLAIKRYAVILLMIFCLFTGCNDPETTERRIEEIQNIQAETFSVYSKYAPAKIDILPLTEYKINEETQEGEINLFVSLLDEYGSQIKSPCSFRFELYPKVQRSSDPKGGRLMIWTDMDLIESKVNNDYWQNYLRAYKFDLLFELQSNQTYILEVTCMCPNGKYLSSEYTLKTQGDS